MRNPWLSTLRIVGMVIALLVLSGLAIAPLSDVAQAAVLCRTVSDRQICILSIKRSAKHYWEYRAAVSIDCVERPIEVYNCRDRLRISAQGKAVPFAPNGAGKLICSFFQRSA
ncbi:MAG TPA: hypothetical protein V6C88_13175 [Chroococcidiopsis sp.]